METIRIECEGSGTLPIEQLVPFQGGLKSLSKENYLKLRSQVLAEGFKFPIFVWQHEGSNYIIDGHQRLNTLKQMKEEGYKIPDVPVAHIKAPTYKSAKKAVLAAASVYGRVEDQGLYEFLDNAGIDIDEIIEKIDLPYVDLEKFKAGYGQDSGNTDPDDVPEPPKVAKTKLGDLYRLGEHRLLCGDSTIRSDVDRLMCGEKADMVFTDPPYGVSYQDKNKMLNRLQPSLGRLETPIHGDDLSLDDLQVLISGVFKNIEYVLAEKSCYYVCSPQGGELGLMMMMMMQESGIPCRHMIIWVKNTPVFSVGRLDYDYKHEPILFGWGPKKTHHKSTQKGQWKSSVWDCDRELNKLHPTMKPVALIENAITNSCPDGGLLFEPFAGSGSALIASEMTGRRCNAIEIDPIYCDVIVKRWEDYTGKKAELIRG